jgi:hypothetical protein
MIEIARDLLPPGQALEVGPADFAHSRLAKADGSVASIFAVGVLGQIAGAAVELARVLRPDGVLVTLDAKSCDREQYAELVRAGGRLKLEELRPLGGFLSPSHFAARARRR